MWADTGGARPMSCLTCAHHTLMSSRLRLCSKLACQWLLANLCNVCVLFKLYGSCLQALVEAPKATGDLGSGIIHHGEEQAVVSSAMHLVWTQGLRMAQPITCVASTRRGTSSMSIAIRGWLAAGPSLLCIASASSCG